MRFPGSVIRGNIAKHAFVLGREDESEVTGCVRIGG